MNWRRKSLRGFGLLCGGLFLFVGLSIAALSFVAPRNRILALALDRAGSRLSGQITVERAHWPSLGELRIEGIDWVVRDSLLVRGATAVVRVDLSELRHRDLHVLGLRLEAERVDVPALRRVFAAISGTAGDEAEATPDATEPSARAFPRAGALLPFPSLAIDSLSVVLDELVLSDSLSLSAEIAGRINLLHGADPTAELQTFRVADSRGWPQISAGHLTYAGQSLRADFQIEPRAGWFVQLGFDSNEANRIHLRLSEVQLPQDWGTPVVLDLDGRFEREFTTLEALQVNAKLSTPTMNQLSLRPGLAAVATAVPAGSFESEIRLDADLGEDPRIGLLWTFAEGDTAAGLTGTLRADTFGPLVAPQVDLAVQILAGSGDRNRLPFDRIAITAYSAKAGSSAVSVAADFLLPGTEPVSIEMRAKAEPNDNGWQIRLDPIQIEAGANGAPRPDPSIATERRVNWVHSAFPLSSLHGVVQLDDSGATSFRQFRVIGDFGDLTVDGAIDPEQRGRLSVRGEWRTIPGPLLSRLSSELSLQSRLHRDWQADGPFFAEGTVHMNEDSSPELSVRADFDLFLPGPGTLSALLPESAQRDSLGPARGHLHAEVDGTDWSALLNLQGRGWLDDSHLSLHSRGGTTKLDSSFVLLPGLDLRFSGEQSPGRVQLRTNVKVDSLILLSRLGIELPSYEEVDLRADATWVGERGDPQFEFDLSGGFSSAGLLVPEVSGRAHWSRQGGELSLTLPAGLVTPSVTLDEVGMELSGLHEGERSGRIRLAASGPDLQILQVASIVQDSTQWTVETDSLRLVLGDESLENETPFRVVYESGAGRLEIANFALGGQLGSIRADGITSAEVVDFEIHASLDLPAQPSSVDLPVGLWPREIELDLAAKGATDLGLECEIRGISLPGREDLVANLTARSELGRVMVDASLSPADPVHAQEQQLLLGHAQLPLRVTVYPPELVIEAGEVDLRLQTWNLPVAWPAREPGRGSRGVGVVTGLVQIGGATDSPAVVARGELSFPDWEEMSDYLLGFDGEYTHVEGAAESAVESRLWITRAGVDRIRGDVRYPVSISLQPFSLELVPTGEMTATLRSEVLQLEDYSPLLGGDYTVEGICQFDLAAEGNPRDPTLTGKFESSELSVRMPDGTHIGGSSALAFSGTGRQPRLDGEVSVTSGVLVLPETPKDLLAVEGESRLWALSDSLRGDVVAVSDSIEVHPSAHPDTASVIRPAVDLVIEIPGSFWIRGGGLEVELAGRLDLKDRGVPLVNGNLEAKEGHLTLLGRYFEVDHGSVGFYGEEEIDPVLDLTLSTRISGTSFYVDVTGRASAPRLALRSEPEMPEGDILSFLVLGRPIEELNQDQLGLLRSRATDIAAAFGTAQMGQKLAGQLGIDLVSVQQSSEVEGGSSLVFGKYLSPRLLLKYEQALGEGQGWLVNLEYLLTEHLRLESLYGQQNQSGAEINWINEY